MKTAIQEAIEIIEERLKILSIVQRTESTMGAIAGYQYSKYLLMELLEKEKEQIIELPSDEEIDKYIEKTFYGVKKHYFKAGVEFMRELILKKNNL